MAAMRQVDQPLARHNSSYVRSDLLGLKVQMDVFHWYRVDPIPRLPQINRAADHPRIHDTKTTSHMIVTNLLPVSLIDGIGSGAGRDV